MNYQQANSTNLPNVSPVMAWEYVKSEENYTLSEIRGAKNDMYVF